MNIEKLAERIIQKRAGKGVRQAATEANISPSTLSRIENNNIPDLETFEKICLWLGDDPSIYLGEGILSKASYKAQVHFKKEIAIQPDTAEALTEMILLAHKSLMQEDEVK